MRHLVVALSLLLLAGCYKVNLAPGLPATHSPGWLTTIQAALRDSLPSATYASLDFSRYKISPAPIEGNCYIRIARKELNYADDFILALADSSTGHIVAGRVVKVCEHVFHVTAFNGDKIALPVASSARVVQQMETIAGEQELAGVEVTAYLPSGGAGITYYNYASLFATVITGSSTLYSPSAYAAGGGTTDEVLLLALEGVLNPAIDPKQYLNCFSLLKDSGAVYSIVLCSDLPVNGDPNKLFDPMTGAVGHTFLQLKKSNSSEVIQQSLGFYPMTGWKAVEGSPPVQSKITDNAGHKFNASLEVKIDAAHFQAALMNVLYYGSQKYSMVNFNCTDFALNIFNDAVPVNLDVPKYQLPGSMIGELSNTPQGVYIALQDLQKKGGYAGGEITIPGVCGYIGGSHGACP